MTRYGLCCHSLQLQDQGYKFQTMTFKRFDALPRDEAIETLGDRIVNNLIVTNECLRLCAKNNWCYRLSSDIFPLITYEAANVDLIDLPQIDAIYDKFDIIKDTITTHDIRVSTHPSQFFVLASTNQASVDRTVNELNFFSSFMDFIGCSENYDSPINIHINNKQGSHQDVIARFMSGYSRLDDNCRKRLVIENDDKSGGWSVQELIEHFHPATNIPITFDYLHNKCNPSTDLDYTEKMCVKLCYHTWHSHKPLFHYSESRPGNNPRAHCDIPTEPFNTYDLDFDVDMEVKLKDQAIMQYQNQLISNNRCCVS